MVQQSYRDLLSEAGFPAADAWEAVARLMEGHSEDQRPVRNEWAGGWNALAYRFLGCHMEGERLRAMLSDPGSDAPPPMVRAEQEHRLFAFYSAGLSSFETLAYAAHAIGALVEPQAFPFATDDDRKAVSLRSVAVRFAETFPHEPLSVALERVLRSPEFRTWCDVRNVLMHRTAPGRTIYASPGVVRTRACSKNEAGSTHPDHDPRTLANDVAVVRLAAPVVLGTYPVLLGGGAPGRQRGPAVLHVPVRRIDPEQPEPAGQQQRQRSERNLLRRLGWPLLLGDLARARLGHEATTTAARST